MCELKDMTVEVSQLENNENKHGKEKNGVVQRLSIRSKRIARKEREKRKKYWQQCLTVFPQTNVRLKI
jgi:hypothetical protein